MRSDIDQQPEQVQTYEQVRDARRAKRKADRAARKAAKPKGIDLPFRKSMHPALLIAFVVVTLVTLVLVVAVMVRPPTPQIPLAERRSPPGPSVSHNVGPIVLAPIPDQVPVTKAPCEEFEGVMIEGGPAAHTRIGGVLERMCSHAKEDTDVGRSLRALRGARIRFARFARTGDYSTLSTADPARVLINIRFAQRDTYALFIAPLLAHEGFHLLQRGVPWSAKLEFAARRVEAETCRIMIPIDAWPRGCSDAQSLVDFGEVQGTEMLVRAGFPR